MMHIILFSLIAFLLVFVLNYCLKQTNWYNNQFVDSRKFSVGISDNLEVVNLGSTQPKYAFDYSSTEVEGMNMALGPQPFEYDFKILRQYRRKLKEKAFVLIPICPFKYFVDVYSNDAANIKYYPFLESSQINGFSKFKKQIYLHYPILQIIKNPRILLQLIKATRTNNNYLLDHNPMNRLEIERDASGWVDGWKKQFGLSELNDIVLSEGNKHSIEKNRERVKDALLYCKEQGLRPAFVLLPSTEALSSKFPDSFIRKHVLDNIEASNVINAPILNYFKDQRFTSSKHYINTFFFNAKGRRLFTDVILEDLKQIN